MHVFLTGEVQVGKSTIIKRWLDATGLRADGFKTYWQPAADGGTDLYIHPFGTPIVSELNFLAAHRSDNRRWVYEAAFEQAAESFMYDCGKKDIIIMDELGFMESRAMAFQRAVMDILDRGDPVLGVIKPRPVPFLDAIRARGDVETISVTRENRDEILQELVRRHRENGKL